MKHLIYIALLMVLCSCTTTKYVPVTQIKHEVEYRDRVRTDSIHTVDSVVLLVKGDTIYRDRVRYIYKDRYIADTVHVNTSDTVPIVQEIEVTKEVVPRWAWWSLAYFGVTILIFSMIILRKIKIM